MFAHRWCRTERNFQVSLQSFSSLPKLPKTPSNQPPIKSQIPLLYSPKSPCQVQAPLLNSKAPLQSFQVPLQSVSKSPFTLSKLPSNHSKSPSNQFQVPLKLSNPPPIRMFSSTPADTSISEVFKDLLVFGTPSNLGLILLSF